MRRLPAAMVATVLVASLGGCRDGTEAVRRSPSPTVASPMPSPAGFPASPTPASGVLTPPPAGATVIGVLGDYGIERPAVHQVVALLRRFGGGRDLAAVVTTGDNAYPRGARSEAAFARQVLEPALGPRTRLVASLGNHDVATASGAHVMRSLGIPARWYTAVVGPVELVVLDANQPSNAAQLAFLDRALAAPRRVPFRVAVFHQPAMSCSFHQPSRSVVRYWVPRFAGRVDLVLSGHNHTYERFATTRGPAYVTTGGGGAQLYPSYRAGCSGPGRVVHYRTVHHAVRLVVTDDALLLEAVDTDGTVFDRLRLTA